MKKIICLLLAAMLAVLPSCSLKKDESTAADTTTADTKEALTTEDESTVADTSQDTPDEEIRVSVETHILPSDSAEQRAAVHYPVVSGTVNDELANSLLKEYLIGYASDGVNENFDSEFHKDYSYELHEPTLTFANKSLVSFFLEGELSSSMKVRPEYFALTLNLDITTGKFMVIEDFCRDTDAVSELFIGGDTFSVIYSGSDDMKAELDAAGRNELDTWTMPYIIRENGETYFAVSVSVPAVMGSHAEYKAKLSDVEHLLSDEILELTKGNK